MPAKATHKKKPTGLHPLVFLTIGFILALIAAGMGYFIFEFNQVANQQKALQPFYTLPNPLPNDKPGDIIRSEEMNISVPANAKAYRILYLSETEISKPTVSSGMIFVPSHKTSHNQPIVAWAHGTIGMGQQCAPSRSINPMENIGGLSQMLQNGWIVVATDYSGLGTPGIEPYLIGNREAYDVLNSVRAAKNFVKEASNQFALWGHSQGGHSVLFSAQLAKDYTPELKLVAASVAAPVAELKQLINLEYQTAAAWVIGPELLASWTQLYPTITTVLSNEALTNYKRLAEECINEAGVEGIIRNKLNEPFFTTNPVTNDTWNQALKEQTPQPLSSDVPLFIAQGLEDSVVLPSTTALFVQRSCEKNSNLTTYWMKGVGHIDAGKVAGPFVVSWLQDRFAGRLTQNTCLHPLPVKPAKEI